MTVGYWAALGGPTRSPTTTRERHECTAMCIHSAELRTSSPVWPFQPNRRVESITRPSFLLSACRPWNLCLGLICPHLHKCSWNLTVRPAACRILEPPVLYGGDRYIFPALLNDVRRQLRHSWALSPWLGRQQVAMEPSLAVAGLLLVVDAGGRPAIIAMVTYWHGPARPRPWPCPWPYMSRNGSRRFPNSKRATSRQMNPDLPRNREEHSLINYSLMPVWIYLFEKKSTIFQNLDMGLS
jgi:hypothetical protein